MNNELLHGLPETKKTVQEANENIKQVREEIASELNIDEIVKHYLVAALWTEELDEFDVDNFNPDSVADAKAEVTSFVEKAGDLLNGIPEENIGHDFWLTRNHHGAGFWDREELSKEQQEGLTKIADSFGDRWVFEENGTVFVESNSSDKDSVEEGTGIDKNYYVMYNVGKVKYLVNYHDGEKTHKDGSPFYDIATFKNIPSMEAFIKELTEKGYKETVGGILSTPTKESQEITEDVNPNILDLEISRDHIEKFVAERKLTDNEWKEFEDWLLYTPGNFEDMVKETLAKEWIDFQDMLDANKDE